MIKLSENEIFAFPKALLVATQSVENGVADGTWIKGLNPSEIQHKLASSHIFLLKLPDKYTQVPHEQRPEISEDLVEGMMQRLSLPYPVIYHEQTDDRVFTLQLKNSITGEVLNETFTFVWGFFIEISPTRILACVQILHSEYVNNVSDASQAKVKDSRIAWVDINMEKPMYHINIWRGVVSYIDRINECLLSAESIGSENSNRQVPYKVGSHKFSRKIGRIVRIQSGGQKDRPSALISRTIEWESSWFVRGHWRRKPGGLGKNRAGEYKIEGFTWVSSHKRGNKDAEAEPRIYIKD